MLILVAQTIKSNSVTILKVIRLFDTITFCYGHMIDEARRCCVSIRQYRTDKCVCQCAWHCPLPICAKHDGRYQWIHWCQHGGKQSTAIVCVPINNHLENKVATTFDNGSIDIRQDVGWLASSCQAGINQHHLR